MTKQPNMQTLTDEYINALMKTPEMRAYLEAKTTYNADVAAKKLLADFQEAQRTYRVFQQGGFDGAGVQQEKLKWLNDKLNKNEQIQNLIKSQDALTALVGSLAASITRGINFPFESPKRGGCCG